MGIKNKNITHKQNMRTFAALALLAVASAIHAPEGAPAQLDAGEGQAPEGDRPSRDDVGELAEACGWLAGLVDWEALKALEEDGAGEEDLLDEVWAQLGDRDEVEQADFDRDDVGQLAGACVEIERADRDFREAKGAVELTPGEFFAACKWLNDSITDGAFEAITEELTEAEAAAALDGLWDEVKDSPEAQGWTKEAAQEVAEHCLSLGKRIEEDEGVRPRLPRQGGDDGEGPEEDSQDEDTQEEDEDDGPSDEEQGADGEGRRGGDDEDRREDGEDGPGDEERPEEEEPTDGQLAQRRWVA